MWWRLTKTIIISWFIGVICGAGLVVLRERQDRTAPAVAAGDQGTSQPKSAAPGSPEPSGR
jgi:hypothetical protein